ncbi:hypothetical protein DLD77_00835 [Chitinophaga alhagiae]|uniref:D-isomer specific 2-hydroxyacid dehydrogenase NAD-binding domain-containing protein n=1 Tax=Chitinophaga alhagiae TaxID=2203219 RepID=A0ABM6W8V6_9BACT|nr:D-2-hydroxyacid dehydrogenase [Chitinophaga alhagiae]AWO00352.1 hypothetical protein DLD77_00835 [Chitinophaga alhagiae]
MKILIDVPVYKPALDRLRQRQGLYVEVVEPPAEYLRPLPVDRIEDCDVLFCTIPPENHRQMKKLQFIQICSAGYTQLAGAGFPERGVRASNALGVFDVPIAEWNIAMMINLKRNLRQMVRNQEAAVWDRSAVFQQEIRGSVVGIWGYGGIGRETARLARAMGMRVHVLGRRRPPVRSNTYVVAGTGDPDGTGYDRFFPLESKADFLRGLDFLIIAMPGTPETLGMVSAEDLKMLPAHAFVLNPARGPIIQEQALLQALRENWIAGAALDTHYYYPMPPDHPLWRMPQVILTPHISGSSASNRFKERIWDIFTQNVDRLLNGENLLNELSPAQLQPA